MNYSTAAGSMVGLPDQSPRLPPPYASRLQMDGGGGGNGSMTGGNDFGLQPQQRSSPMNLGRAAAMLPSGSPMMLSSSTTSPMISSHDRQYGSNNGGGSVCGTPTMNGSRSINHHLSGAAAQQHSSSMMMMSPSDHRLMNGSDADARMFHQNAATMLSDSHQLNSLSSSRGDSPRLNEGRAASKQRNQQHHNNLNINTSESKVSQRFRRGGVGGATVSDDIVEVQILPQDDNWGDNTTCITGATSERSISAEDISKLGGTDRDAGLSGPLFLVRMWLSSVIAGLLSLVALASPLLMLLVPKLPLWEQPWRVQACGPECDGLLISFAFKLVLLFGACWAVFFRRPRATLPRIFVFRGLLMVVTLILLAACWIFYSARIYDKRYDDFDLTYLSIVHFATSLVDGLLVVHYFGVILLEIRHLQPQYFVKVVRSPDGASKGYTLGAISIQRAAALLLENYVRDFPVYNPFLEHLPLNSVPGANGSSRGLMNSSKSSSKSFKVYDLNSGLSSQGGSGAASHLNSGRRTTERMYAEHEYDKKVRKRRARLITAVEDAFTHIKRVVGGGFGGGADGGESGTQIHMDSREAAQAVFPSMARPLQKYLRITRQQPRHTMQGILEHLATCLHYDLSPKSFLEKYLKSEPVLQDERELSSSIHSWALVCDILPYRPIKNGVVFILRQGDVSLIATVSDLPHFNITEEVVDPKCNKFVLRLQSETSV